MNTVKIYIAFFLAFMVFPAHALVITDRILDRKINSDYTTIATDMLALGYDPERDIVNSIRLTLRFSGIVEDDGLDEYGEVDLTKQVHFYTRLFGVRMWVHTNVENEVISFLETYLPGQDSCINWDWGGCTYDPLETGNFGILFWTSNENLWLDEALWELDITRQHVNEPAPFILSLLGGLALLISRRRIAG